MNVYFLPKLNVVYFEKYPLQLDSFISESDTIVQCIWNTHIFPYNGLTYYNMKESDMVTQTHSLDIANRSYRFW